MALPIESKKNLWKQIKHGGFREIMQSLTSIHVESAKASRAEDEVHIKNIIRNTIGFAAVNEKVKHALSQWLVENFEECVTESSVSDVAHVLFSLIKGSNAERDRKPAFGRSVTSLVLSRTSSLSPIEKCTSNHFNFLEWKAAVTKHPRVLEFLELDVEDITASFLTFAPNADGGVHIKSFDCFLIDRRKHNMNDFLLWLGASRNESDHVQDTALESILQEGLLRLQRNANTIKDELKHQQYVTEELAKLADNPWSL